MRWGDMTDKVLARVIFLAAKAEREKEDFEELRRRGAWIPRRGGFGQTLFAGLAASTSIGSAHMMFWQGSWQAAAGLACVTAMFAAMSWWSGGEEEETAEDGERSSPKMMAKAEMLTIRGSACSGAGKLKKKRL